MSWEIQHGDALALLGALEDGSVDAVVTDPPYLSGGQFRSDRNGSAKAKYLDGDSAAISRLPDFYGDNRTERALLLWCALWMGECWRVAKDGAAIAVFCDWRSMPTMSDALQVAGWSWRGTGVWIKPPGKSRPVMAGLWNDTEFVLWGSRGGRTEGECLPGTWQVASPASDMRMHVTEKPQVILRDLVRLAHVGGLVVDPFTGSGSTGVAAVEQGRRFVGMELSSEYCAIARRRLSQLDQFGSDVSYVGTPTIFDGAA